MQPEFRLLTQQEFENAIERVFYIYKEYIKEEYDENPPQTWREWLKVAGPDSVVITLENEANIYYKYFSVLPENMRVADVMDLYLKGELPDYRPSPAFQNIPIEPTEGIQRTTYWQPSELPVYTSRKIKNLYNTARQRVTSQNKSQVLKARKELLFIFNRNPNIAKDSGIEAKGLNSWIRSYSGMSVNDRQLEYQLNQGVPDEHQWLGFSNSSWINRYSIEPEELDQFVGDIDVLDEADSQWRGQTGDTLRRYIMNTFLSIDTRILYDDLNFMIGQCKKPSSHGQYFHQKTSLHGKEIKPKTVVISSLFQNTVAHEIGHYLDYKWGGQYGWEGNPLSYGQFNHAGLPKVHRDWLQKFKQFIAQIEDKAEISSEYLQRRSEVFARFINAFCQWASKRKDVYYPDFDKFGPSDFKLFVRLLQEKSFIDAKYPFQHPARFQERPNKTMAKIKSKNWIEKICSK